MIYDPITRQQVEIIGQYATQKVCYRFGKKERGNFDFVRVRYGDYVNPSFSGGFPIGEERDVDRCSLVADEGSREIDRVANAAPRLE